MASNSSSRAVRTGEIAPAKIARPVLSGVIARPRLFALLDAARTRPITWIVAPPGSGKTSLIASYLEEQQSRPLWYQMDPSDSDVASFFYYMSWAARLVGTPSPQPLSLLTDEYKKGLASFTHNFFRELFARLARPSVLVLDDYHLVDATASTHEVIQQGFDEIPADVRVFVISREGPHGAFARLRASERIALLSADDLRLTEEETAKLITVRTTTAGVPEHLAQTLHRRTQGWVAGIVLLTESVTALNGEPTDAAALAHDHVVFDYFANEIFRHRTEAEQKILIKTAFLAEITEPLVREISGRDDGGALLNELARRGYFTVQRASGSYEYHPLFRAFLVNHAKQVLTKEALRELKVRSARLLADAGETEAAIDLLQQEEFWEAARELLLRSFRAYLDQGRTQTLQTIVERFPNELREADAWLLYLQGTCLLPLAPAQARSLFERAFAQFETGADSSPLHYVWIGIMESFVLESRDLTPMRAWIERYSSLAQGRTPSDPTSESLSLFKYLEAVRLTCPEHPDFIALGERAEALFQEETDTRRKLWQATILISYYSWRGQIGRVRELLETFELVASQPALPRIERVIWLLMRGIYNHNTGSIDESANAIQAGLALGDSIGVHAVDTQLLAYGISGQIRVGNLEAARGMLQRLASKMEPYQAASPFYYLYSSMLLLQEGNPAGALDDAQRARQASTNASFVLGTIYAMLCEACALGQLQRVDEALSIVDQAHAMAQRGGGKLFECYCLHVRAHLLKRRGDFENALTVLRASLELAHEMNICTSRWCRREDSAALYAMALNAGIHSDYVSSMIVKMRLQPPDRFSEKWPWSLRLYTLGRFVMVKDGAPLHFGGKAQLKPLELLRVLVTYGGRDVSFATVATVLWPDSDGDMAKTALETTVHRLRRLLGEKCILKHMGLLSLNPECCWLDAWTFEYLADHLEAVTAASATPRRLIELYQGSFLPNDDSTRAVGQRERLRSKFLRAVVHYGKQYESLEQWEDALSLYQQGIEADPTAEELYRLVMQCYQRLERFAEAVAAYRRCERVLAAELNAEPSRDSQLLHRAISHEMPRASQRN